MNRFRLPLLAAGALVALVTVAAAVVFSTSFQTWMARRTLAKHPGWQGGVGAVSAGLSRIVIKELQLQRDGAALKMPVLEADLPVVAAAWSQRVAVSRLVARGWTLDLSGTSSTTPAGTFPGAPSGSTPAARGTPPAGAPGPAATSASGGSLAAARHMFAGVFRQLDLPVDLSLAGVVLEGDVILPENRGRVKVSITGGGLAAGREGRFSVTAAAALSDPAVSVVDVKGSVVAAMATPRSFGRFLVQLDASARGLRFPQGVGLRADLAAERVAAGETYSAAVVADGRSLIDLRAELPSGGPRLTGTWKLNVRESDVVPFSLGVPLPEFAIAGEGGIDADAAFTAIHLLGRLDATVDRWHVLRPELAAVGRLNVVADFDLTEQAGTLGVRKLDLAIRGNNPIAEVRTLQAFDFTPATRELRTADTERELFGLVLQGVPIDWARPWLSTVQLSGGRLQGGLTARAHQGGVSLRSTSPLTMADLGVFQAGKLLIRNVDLTVRASADFTPQGWQAELSEGVARSGAAELLTWDLKLGRLMGAAQPVKAAGRLTANLPAVLAQPVAAGLMALKSGTVAVDFAASVDGKRELQATVNVRDLAAVAGANPVPLPELATRLRADLTPDGAMAFNAPITLVKDGRTSELTFVGTIGPEKKGARSVEAEINGKDVHWEDVQVLAVALPVKPVGAAAGPVAPPWAGLHGSVGLRLQRVIYSDTFEIREVTGRLRLDAGMLRLEGGQAGLGEEGRASVNGLVTFDPEAKPAYGMVADVNVRNFDLAPLLRPRLADMKATVEGRFDLNSRVAGYAHSFGGLIEQAGGELQLTSKGGVFRGLPVSVSTITETTSRWTAWLATAGSALSAVTGRRDTLEVANKTEAVAEVARALHPIVYDQLSVVVGRDDTRNLMLRDFALISPELRLSGRGTVSPQGAAGLLDDALTMEFSLRARGRPAELLKYLGVLEAQTDDLGYSGCTFPLSVGGTLGRPDTRDLSGRLSALAIEKSGLGEKAAEFLAWIRGGK
jgi:hypothetical protein